MVKLATCEAILLKKIKLVNEKLEELQNIADENALSLLM